MKAKFGLYGSEAEMAIELLAETDFEQSFIDHFKETIPTVQICCSARKALLLLGKKLTKKG